MLKDIADIAPKALVVSIIAWGGANYFIIGPEIASRVVRADHVPLCEGNFKNLVAKAADEQAASIPLPQIDAAQEFAADQARRMLNSPFMNDLRGMSQGMGDYFGFDGTVQQTFALIEQQKRAAREAYERSLAQLKDKTASDLARAGDVCGCVADQAIGETRTDWAIFSGTLSVIRPTSLKLFDQKMVRVHASGGCTAAKTGS
ncbi:hypothetical protein [Mesorhizobium sp. J428]|uniref:hypothetical protein n=1 Tax=Mesorhizobium sp. J428 TaxID=2898440 RepID=UPI002151DA10|nr:hypothetical protein [Mesorhizobium sp. J428]MCR5858268.1 hypothetical protein [Mesorhizobium sp. J428]